MPGDPLADGGAGMTGTGRDRGAGAGRGAGPDGGAGADQGAGAGRGAGREGDAGAEGGGRAEGGAGRIDVAVVDDHPIILDGITGWVTVPESGIRVVATAATVDAVLAGPGRRAQVVLLDLDLGDGTAPA